MRKKGLSWDIFHTCKCEEEQKGERNLPAKKRQLKIVGMRFADTVEQPSSYGLINIFLRSCLIPVAHFHYRITLLIFLTTNFQDDFFPNILQYIDLKFNWINFSPCLVSWQRERLRGQIPVEESAKFFWKQNIWTKPLNYPSALWAPGCLRLFKVV